MGKIFKSTIKIGFRVATLTVLFFNFIATPVYAQYGQVNSYGNNISSNTYDDSPLTVTTGRVSNLTDSSVLLSGLVNGSSVYSIYNSNAWFQYGTSVNMEYSTSRITAGSSSGYASFITNISGLKDNTTYYFRAVAQNSRGIFYGGIDTFKTNPAEIIISDKSVNQVIQQPPAPKTLTKTAAPAVVTTEPTPNARVFTPILPITVLGWLVLLILILVLVLVIKHTHLKFSKPKANKTQH